MHLNLILFLVYKKIIIDTKNSILLILTLFYQMQLFNIFEVFVKLKNLTFKRILSDLF